MTDSDPAHHGRHARDAEPEENSAIDPLLGHSHRQVHQRRWPGCLAVLVVLVLVIGGLWVGGTKAYHWLEDTFAAPADYSGPGTGKVNFEVHQGDSAAVIGRHLKKAGVVKSAEAFIDAAKADPSSAGIQVGYYVVRKKMRAKDALKVLENPKNLVQEVVSIPEGLRSDEIVDRLAKKTGIKRARFEALLDQPAKIGLPAQAKGDPEGYLFPATYAFKPKETPRGMLRAMTDRWKQAAKDTGLAAAARRTGRTPRELMTIASLVEAESPPHYMAKVSRVIYNRLAEGMKLQLDATVNFAAHADGARTSEASRAVDSPYNTYKYTGLPPGPIVSPGEDAMRAATSPAEGDWLYYVTVNLQTGETKFATTYAQHQKHVAELDHYCQTKSQGACG